MLRLRSCASSMISVSYRREGVVAGELGEQDAVGHELDQGVLADLVGEPDLVPDDVAELGAQLLGDPVGDRARGQPPRLGVADHPGDAAAQVEADLGNLRRLPRAGLAGDDHDLVVADRGGDVVAAGGDGQRGRVGDARDGGAAGGEPGLGGVESGDERGERLVAVGVPRAYGGPKSRRRRRRWASNRPSAAMRSRRLDDIDGEGGAAVGIDSGAARGGAVGGCAARGGRDVRPAGVGLGHAWTSPGRRPGSGCSDVCAPGRRGAVWDDAGHRRPGWWTRCGGRRPGARRRRGRSWGKQCAGSESDGAEAGA